MRVPMSKPVLEDLFKWSGRRDRKSYALLNLAMFGFGMAATVLWIIEAELSGDPDTAFGTLIVLIVMFCVMGVSSIATTAQRCRDLGMPGVVSAVIMLPYAGIAAWIAILVMPGDKGPNKFGADPRGLKA
ncbi:hypothetical protein LCGC14_0408320 [marine sediment metagenome]|uniref:DUF805 domain-containing protein n=3 Tax=root TaxID=1 RepID=A0A7V1FNN3_9RHOB|nr:DUF805 domain-containing protein [Sulfitobacter litoralis]